MKYCIERICPTGDVSEELETTPMKRKLTETQSY